MHYPITINYRDNSIIIEKYIKTDEPKTNEIKVVQNPYCCRFNITCKAKTREIRIKNICIKKANVDP